MTLKKRLEARIKKEGPISISEFMAACLLDEEFGYYRRGEPIGKHGAFTTAPEISQMFGELVGIFLAKAWIDQGQPSPCTIAELGPGKGTMMSDLLRSAAKVDCFIESAKIVLVESSPALRKHQKKKLAASNPVWIDHVEDMPNQPIFLVANEFFDSLPICQFRRHESGWNEIVVQVGGEGLEFAESSTDSAPFKADEFSDVAVGGIVETRPQAISTITALANTISKHGGVALLIDYGSSHSQGDTLQAVKNHEFASILNEPGEADVSAHVDFGAIKTAAKTVACTELLPQGIWLQRMGITHRFHSLNASMDKKQMHQHLSAYRRLVHSEEMGTLFKCMALYPFEGTTPPGFNP